MATLLLNGAGKDALNNRGETPLGLAAEEGHLGAVKTLLAACVDVNMHSTADGSTALHSAAYYRHDKVVDALLSSGADKDALDNDGTTPLMRAAGEGSLGAVKSLLTAGADLNMQSAYDGGCALHHAACFGHDKIMDALLSSGVDKDALSHNGETPLMPAARSGHLVPAEIILAAGADVNIHSAYGSTSLQFAACFGHDEIVDALLSSGADKNAHGNTPLLSAAGSGHLVVVEALLTPVLMSISAA